MGVVGSCRKADRSSCARLMVSLEQGPSSLPTIIMASERQLSEACANTAHTHLRLVWVGPGGCEIGGGDHDAVSDVPPSVRVPHRGLHRDGHSARGCSSGQPGPSHRSHQTYTITPHRYRISLVERLMDSPGGSAASESRVGEQSSIQTRARKPTPIPPAHKPTHPHIHASHRL